MIIASWYEHREEFIMTEFGGNDFKEIPLSAKNLMYKYRIKGF